jgi:O-antigen ligase
MTEVAINSSLSKSKGQVVLEYALLGLCLCIISLRATFTEGLTGQSGIQPFNFIDNIYGLTVSGLLILSFIVWFVFGVCGRKFCYRFSGVEIGLFIFAATAVAAGFAASNKRAAITEGVCFITAPLCGVLLVQILDRRWKIKVVLVIIGALGVVSAWQCAEQFFVSNQMMIEQYEEAPESIMEPLGLRPDTFEHMMFEHRLYSKGVRGFFTTSNSAGAFAILASFAAVALFIEKFKNLKDSRPISRGFFACGLGTGVVIFGFVITQSKGAIAASLISAAMLAMYILFRDWVKAHKRTILIGCLLLFIGGASVVVWYGLSQGRLPGGNSMLVRWQYWVGAFKMYSKHPLRGVGGGNFTYFYTHYKAAGALEAVADPHNSLLSILSQYGPVGLVGFLAMFFLPLWKVTSSAGAGLSSQSRGPDSVFGKGTAVLLIVISVFLLFIRPLLIPFTADESIGVTAYLLFTLYAVPVIALAVGVFLLTMNGNTDEMNRVHVTSAVVFCGVMGVLIHSLIDFAIFEPGVFTALWAIIACLIALDAEQKQRAPLVLKSIPAVKMIVFAAGVVLIWGYFNYAFIPVVKTSAKIQRAMRESEGAYRLLEQAAEADKLDAAALRLNGKLYLQQYIESGQREPSLLEKAQECYLRTTERNEADFKNYENLSTVYNLLADRASGEEKKDQLNKAFASSKRAVELYPGLGRLRIASAKIAEQSGKIEYASEQYKKAIEIEDAYRKQFRIMYPSREIFSRLGEDNYNFAVKQIEKLSSKTNK